MFAHFGVQVLFQVVPTSPRPPGQSLSFSAQSFFWTYRLADWSPPNVSPLSIAPATKNGTIILMSPLIYLQLVAGTIGSIVQSFGVDVWSLPDHDHGYLDSSQFSPNSAVFSGVFGGALERGRPAGKSVN